MGIYLSCAIDIMIIVVNIRQITEVDAALSLICSYCTELQLIFYLYRYKRFYHPFVDCV